MKRLILISSACIAQAATTVTISPTATQALLRIHTDQAGNCSVRASEGSAIGALVYDVDTAKFPGSNSDARAGAIPGVERFFVLGTRTAARASDGKWYSRALQANTLHTVVITCGADTITQTFKTVNPPLGDVAGETVPVDLAAPYNAAMPSIDLSMTNGIDTGQATKYIDPQTGLQLVRITGPMQGSSVFPIKQGTPPAAFDPASAWTAPQNAIATSGFATTSNAGAANALFIPLGLPDSVNYSSFGQWGDILEMDDLNYTVNGSGSSAAAGDRTLSACISLHHGAACDTGTVTFTLPQNSAGVISFPGASATTWSPFWKLWTQSTPYPAPTDLGTRNGTATAAGNQVTWQSGAAFSNRWVAGDRFKLTGSGCSNGGTDYCTIATVVDSKHLTVSETVSVSSAAAFSVQNAGLKIWKNTSTGSVSLNTVQYYAPFGENYQTQANETKDTCNPNTFNLTANRDGSTRSPGVPARLCQFQGGGGKHAVYVWVPSTGEAWHVANGATTYPGPGGADQTSTGGVCAAQAPMWHPSDPFSWFCQGVTGSRYAVMFHFTYNYAPGTGQCNGREWNDATYGNVVENPCASYVNDTPGSANKDLVTLFQNLDPSFDPAYFSNLVAVGGFGRYVAFEFRSAYQNTMAYFGWYDVLLKTFVKSSDSFRAYPLRWGTSHGNTLVHNTDSSWSQVAVNRMTSFRGQSKGNDLSEMSVVSVNGRSDTSIPATFASACPSGLDARWQALGATPGAMKCVQITVDGQPRLENPSGADQAKWPVSALNPSWRQIQPIAEGDELADNGLPNYTEHMMVVRITPGSGNQLILDLLRNPTWVGLIYCNTPSDHAASWIPVMVTTGSCVAGIDYWVNVAGNASAIAETEPIGGAHADSSGIGPNGGIIAASGSCRKGAIPDAAGTAAYYCDPWTIAFNGSNPAATAFITESHPSYRQVKAPPSEQTWIIDGHPYGGATGGYAPICSLGSVSLQPGTTTVYKLALTGGSCPATLDTKNFPLEVTAGRFLLADMSSPATGNQVTDSTPYHWCYARNANECRSGSSAGDVYAAIPFGETGTTCGSSTYDVNAPCVFNSYGFYANLVQAVVSTPDVNGAGVRRLGHGLTVPTHPSGYWSGTPDPDGQWVFFSPVFADNMVLNQYFAYKLPPLPPRDNVMRNSFINVPVTVKGSPGDTVRVRFGYAEFGPVDGSPNSLYCRSRAETCYTTTTPTSSNPFVFAGETQSYVACDSGCTVNIPALANHVVYYLYERKNGSSVFTGPVQATAVP
jgi:hypothetical protein